MTWPFKKNDPQDGDEGPSKQKKKGKGKSKQDETLSTPSHETQGLSSGGATHSPSREAPPPPSREAPPPPPSREAPPPPSRETPPPPSSHRTAQLPLRHEKPTRPSFKVPRRKPTPQELANEQVMMGEFFRQEHLAISAKKQKHPQTREYPIRMCQTAEQTQIEESRIRRNEQKRIYRLAAQQTGLAGLGEKVSFKGQSRSSQASDTAGEDHSNETEIQGGKLIPSPSAQVNLAHLKAIAEQMDPGAGAGLQDVLLDDEESTDKGKQPMQADEGEGLAQLIQRAEGPRGHEAGKYEDSDLGKFRVYVHEYLSDAAVKRLNIAREWVPRYLYRAAYFDPEDLEGSTTLDFLGVEVDLQARPIGDFKILLEGDLADPITKADGVFARWSCSLLWAVVCALKFNDAAHRGTMHICVLDTMTSGLVNVYQTKFLLDEFGCQTGELRLNLEFPGEHLVCRRARGDVKMSFVRWEELLEMGIMRLLPDLGSVVEPDGAALLAMKALRFQLFEIGSVQAVTEEEAVITKEIAILVGRKFEMPFFVALLAMRKRPHMDEVLLKQLKTLTAGADYPRLHVYADGKMELPPGVPELEEFARLSCDWVEALIRMLGDALPLSRGITIGSGHR